MDTAGTAGRGATGGRRCAVLSGCAGDEANITTMHIVPDAEAVRVLGQAYAKVETMCGDVQVAWKRHVDRFDMNASVPHNCGRARLVLHVPESLRGNANNVSLCVGGLVVGAPSSTAVHWDGIEKNRVAVTVPGGSVQLSLCRCKASLVSPSSDA